MPRDVDTRTLTEGTADAQPLKFVSGALLTTPEAGSVEFLDGSYYLTEIAKRRAISVSADALVSTVTVTNTITETTVYTGPVAVDELRAGKTYRVSLSGTMSTANASQQVTLRLKMGSTTLSTTVVDPSNVTDAGWRAELTITCRTINATGTVSPSSIVFIDGQIVIDVTESVVIDSTVVEDITLTAQWTAANVGNVFSVTQGYMEVLH